MFIHNTHIALENRLKIGAYFKSLRTAQGLSQEKLSKETGICLKTIAFLESGKKERATKIQIISTISNFFGVEPVLVFRKRVKNKNETKVEHDHTCHCGTANTTPHETGKCGCIRFMTDAPALEDGQTIEYPYKQQRGYHQHPCGCWSRWDGSKNSLSA